MEPESRLRGKMSVNNRGSLQGVGAYLMGRKDRCKSGALLVSLLPLLVAIALLLPSGPSFAGEPFSQPNEIPPNAGYDGGYADDGFKVPNAVPPKGTYKGKDVEQPIEFPHYIHTKVNQINCMYCHTYARKSKVAGIPPVSKCMGCHLVIATDKPRIKKLTEYWEKREAPPWKKVHDVCAFCHGELKNMVVARKVKPLNMGFCVRCHEANNGPHDCWKCHK